MKFEVLEDCAMDGVVPGGLSAALCERRVEAQERAEWSEHPFSGSHGWKELVVECIWKCGRAFPGTEELLAPMYVPIP